MEISGVIQRGAGKGAFFTQVDWVVRQCEQMLGFRPFPGTLNVRVIDSDIIHLRQLASGGDFELRPDDPAFCCAQVKRVCLNDIPAAVVIPCEDVRIHETCILEIISACNFKQTLGLKDGDPVRLSWIEASAENRQSTTVDEEAQKKIYREIYEFSASAGALEGYVYPREELKGETLDNWIGNIGKQYRDLPALARESFQGLLDRTLGRAIQSMTPVLGSDHEHVRALTQIIVGEMPRSCHDFEKEKANKASKYGP
jgi:hypothetical protein